MFSCNSCITVDFFFHRSTASSQLNLKHYSFNQPNCAYISSSTSGERTLNTVNQQIRGNQMLKWAYDHKFTRKWELQNHLRTIVQLMSAQNNDHLTHQNILSDDAVGECLTLTRGLVVWSVWCSHWWVFAWVWSQQQITQITQQPIRPSVLHKYIKDQIHETN